MNKISIISGGAGFIGSNLIRPLLEEGRHIAVIDNMSRGSLGNLLDSLYKHELVNVYEVDCSDQTTLCDVFSDVSQFGVIDEIWHLAANSDIPAGVSDAGIDLKDTFLTTFQLVKVAKIFGVRNFHFASSSAIYGDLGEQILHESIGPLLPISNYGAMKLASEAQLSAACEDFLGRVNIFRFPNVVGVPATHGVILDFINKLINTPSYLQVLGDGTQQKSYLHVSDLIGAMLAIRSASSSKNIQVVNIGPLDEGVTVQWIAEEVVKKVSPGAEIVYGNGNKGWVGDVPKFNYSTQKLQSFGWKPQLNSAGAIKQAIHEIAVQLGK